MCFFSESRALNINILYGWLGILYGWSGSRSQFWFFISLKIQFFLFLQYIAMHISNMKNVTEKDSERKWQWKILENLYLKIIVSK